MKFFSAFLSRYSQKIKQKTTNRSLRHKLKFKKRLTYLYFLRINRQDNWKFKIVHFKDTKRKRDARRLGDIYATTFK